MLDAHADALKNQTNTTDSKTTTTTTATKKDANSTDNK